MPRTRPPSPPANCTGDGARHAHARPLVRGNHHGPRQGCYLATGAWSSHSTGPSSRQEPAQLLQTCPGCLALRQYGSHLGTRPAARASPLMPPPAPRPSLRWPPPHVEWLRRDSATGTNMNCLHTIRSQPDALPAWEWNGIPRSKFTTRLSCITPLATVAVKAGVEDSPVQAGAPCRRKTPYGSRPHTRCMRNPTHRSHERQRNPTLPYKARPTANFSVKGGATAHEPRVDATETLLVDHGRHPLNQKPTPPFPSKNQYSPPAFPSTKREVPARSSVPRAATLATGNPARAIATPYIPLSHLIQNTNETVLRSTSTPPRYLWLWATPTERYRDRAPVRARCK